MTTSRHRLYLTHDIYELAMAYILASVFGFASWEIWHYDLLSTAFAPMAIFLMSLLPLAIAMVFVFLFGMSGSRKRREAAEKGEQR